MVSIQTRIPNRNDLVVREMDNSLRKILFPQRCPPLKLSSIRSFMFGIYVRSFMFAHSPIPIKVQIPTAIIIVTINGENFRFLIEHVLEHNFLLSVSSLIWDPRRDQNYLTISPRSPAFNLFYLVLQWFY